MQNQINIIACSRTPSRAEKKHMATHTQTCIQEHPQTQNTQTETVYNFQLEAFNSLALAHGWP